MNEIRVTAYGRLKERLSQDTFVAHGQTVRQAVESLQLDATGGLPLTPVVNGQVVTWDHVLKAGDELMLVPTIGGGGWITKR